MTVFGSLLRSEWTKLISLRSTKLALALGIALALGLTALLAVVAGATQDEWTAADHRSWEPAEGSLIGGVLTTIILTVLAVTAATGEYVSGTIRLTFTATPRRGRVLAAKVLVIAGVALATALLCNLATFGLGQALFAAYGLGTASLWEYDSLRLVFLGAAVAPLLPIVALLIGLVLRSAAATITAWSPSCSGSRCWASCCRAGGRSTSSTTCCSPRPTRSRAGKRRAVRRPRSPRSW